MLTMVSASVASTAPTATTSRAKEVVDSDAWRGSRARGAARSITPYLRRMWRLGVPAENYHGGKSWMVAPSPRVRVACSIFLSFSLSLSFFFIRPGKAWGLSSRLVSHSLSLSLKSLSVLVSGH